LLDLDYSIAPKALTACAILHNICVSAGVVHARDADESDDEADADAVRRLRRAALPDDDAAHPGKRKRQTLLTDLTETLRVRGGMDVDDDADDDAAMDVDA